MKFLLYRYRFLLLYTFFGVVSLIVELSIVKGITSFNIPGWIANIAGVTAGIAVAFILNIRFNFYITKPKRKRALLYFASISLLSFLVQSFFKKRIVPDSISDDLARFLISGVCFLVFYFFHRRFSFNEYKKVGVAIYADGVEDIKKIYKHIKDVCDFIHIDIVDKTFNPNAAEVKAYRAEVVRAYWQHKIIEVHIMSQYPSKWLPDLLPYVDIVYVHLNIQEDMNEVLASIKQAGVKPGIAISLKEDFLKVYDYIDQVHDVLLLAIPNPGYSGQKFDMDILALIDNLYKHPQRGRLTICVDGGVNAQTISYLNVEKVVSGSFVLQAPNPVKNIMYLQTSGNYDKF